MYFHIAEREGCWGAYDFVGFFEEFVGRLGGVLAGTSIMFREKMVEEGSQVCHCKSGDTDLRINRGRIRKKRMDVEIDEACQA